MVIFKNNIKRLFQNKAKLFIIFVLPMIFALLFMTSTNEIKVTMVIQDQDQTPLTELLIDTLKDKNEVIVADEADTRDMLINGEVSYYIQIEPGFTQGILENRETHIRELYYIQPGKLQPTRLYIEQFVSNAKSLALQSKDIAELYTLMKGTGQYFEVQEEIIKSKSTDLTLSGVGFLIQFMIYMSMISATYLLIDREKNTLIRIGTSPIPKARYMFENFLSFIAIAIAQVIIVFIFYTTVMHLNFGPHLLLLMLLMVFYAIASIALCMILVSLAKSEKLAYGVILVAATPLTMLGGCYFELKAMGATIQKISKFLPTTWAMNGARDLIVRGDATNILINYGVLLTFALTFFIISLIGLRKLSTN